MVIVAHLSPEMVPATCPKMLVAVPTEDFEREQLQGNKANLA